MGGEPAAADVEPAPPHLVQRPPRPVGTRDGVPVYRKEVLAPVEVIDRIYPSMKGPMSDTVFSIDPEAAPELFWVTGYAARMMDPDGRVEMSDEFMCHSNFDVAPREYHRRFPSKTTPTGGRLFTLAQGQLSVQFPEGFGLPLVSNQHARLSAQVLNHNIVGDPFGVRQQIEIDFVRDVDLRAPVEVLLPRALVGLKLVDGPDGHSGLTRDEIDEGTHGPGCLVGDDAGGVSDHFVKDGAGRRFTGFWVVKPGREVNHTLVTRNLDLAYDTTIHYIAVHVHPFAESVELRDLTTGETVFKSRARQRENGIGLAEIEHYSSREGLPVYKDHEYEVISVYDNTSGKDQDAMVVLFLYLHAKDLVMYRYGAGPESRGGAEDPG